MCVFVCVCLFVCVCVYVYSKKAGGTFSCSAKTAWPDHSTDQRRPGRHNLHLSLNLALPGCRPRHSASRCLRRRQHAPTWSARSRRLRRRAGWPGVTHGLSMLINPINSVVASQSLECRHASPKLGQDLQAIGWFLTIASSRWANCFNFKA